MPMIYSLYAIDVIDACKAQYHYDQAKNDNSAVRRTGPAPDQPADDESCVHSTFRRMMDCVGFFKLSASCHA